MAAVTGQVRKILHVEGAMLALLAFVIVWPSLPGFWISLIVFLAPDLSMIGFLIGKKFGTVAYNIAHSTVLPILLFVWAHLFGLDTDIAGDVSVVALLWLGHIGVDRALGFGLKYHSAFGHTHLMWRA